MNKRSKKKVLFASPGVQAKAGAGYIALFLIILLPAGCNFTNGFFAKKPSYKNMFARDHNTCKKLEGDALVYVIFVDDPVAGKWSDYDINTRLDSVNAAAMWMEVQAADQGKVLTFDIRHFKTDTSVAVSCALGNPLYNITDRKRGGKKLNRWADKVVAASHGLSSKQELIAQLRNEHKVESVCLLFMLNNYFKYDHSCAVNMSSNLDVEFAVIADKREHTIAHEMLHLFGAMDLYKPVRRNRYITKLFPREVMLNRDMSLASVEISPITQYLVGWTEGLEKQYHKVFRYTDGKRKKRRRRR